MLSFMCAYGLSLLFESPFMAIERVMFSRQPTKKSNSSKQQDEEAPEVVEKIKSKNGSIGGENGIYTIKIKQNEANE